METNLRLLPIFLLLAACSREEPATYRIPKETPAPSSAVPSAPAPRHHSHAAPASDAFTATPPDGWTALPAAGMRKAAYAIAGTSIDFYLIALATGDLAGNVNRWRGQVGLPPATTGDPGAAAHALTIGGRRADYIEIYNEEAGMGIVAAIVERSPEFWYFTAKGTVDELKAHAAGIRQFLESIQFE